MPTAPLPPGTDPVQRTASRRLTTARVVRLGEEPGDDLSAVLAPAGRFALVATLSRRMWGLTGYARAEIPVRVIQRSP